MKLSLGSMSHDVWDLVRSFFEAQAAYRETYDRYETKVLQYAAERGVDRRFLRLDANELSQLLDFKKLEGLRNHQLSHLKQISHNIFRNEDRTDPFDRFASEIFHELSILKEEQYKVEQFAPEYQRQAERQEYESILDEAHEAFPRKVHHIFDLFKRAQARLEELLPYFGRDKILMRSLYLFGDDLLRGFYPNGADDFLSLMYPVGGAIEGYLAVAKSFLESGFREYAIEALEEALRVAAQDESHAPLLADRTGGSAAAPQELGAAAGAEASRAARDGMRREADELLRELKTAPKKKAAALGTAAGADRSSGEGVAGIATGSGTGTGSGSGSGIAGDRVGDADGG